MASSPGDSAEQPDGVNSSPRVEIAPGIFAESVVRRAGEDVAQVYRVTGGVFDRFELDSMSSLAHLVGILSSFDSDELRAWAEEPVAADDELSDRALDRFFANYEDNGARATKDVGHARWELYLPAEAPTASAHRRFACDAGAARRGRIWAAETLGDCLPDTDWSVELLEQTVLRIGELVREAVDARAAAVLVTLEIDGRRLSIGRFDELPGAGG